MKDAAVPGLDHRNPLFQFQKGPIESLPDNRHAATLTGFQFQKGPIEREPLILLPAFSDPFQFQKGPIESVENIERRNAVGVAFQFQKGPIERPIRMSSAR